MAAPTLQAEGSAVQAVTSGNLTVTLAAHAADDILIVLLSGWVPNTASATARCAAPSGWAELNFDQVPAPGGIIDGEWAIFWKRATSSSETNPVFVRPSGWDTGTDTCLAGRAYTIRGCVATGDPWDEQVKSALHSAANQAVAAVTVSGAERMVVHFWACSDDQLTSGPTATGWTAGTLAESGTGTDASFNTLRKDNVSASTSADATTCAAPVQGRYIYFGISFKPPAAPANPTISSASMADADRDWDVPFQDIAITFSEAVDITPAPSVGDTVAGLTAQVNGGAGAALTYRSGNGTASWKVRRAELIQQDDTVVLDYAQASGAILAVDDDAELSETVDAPVTNSLTKRVRLILKDKNDALVASVTVKYGIFQYDSGAPANANWMTRDTKGTATTTAAGLLDVEYTGAVVVGANVYVVVIQPNTTPTEAFAWHQAVD